MKIRSHMTQEGELVTGERLENAIKAVAEDWRELGRRIRGSDNYADHVTEEEKDRLLERHLSSADRFESGEGMPSFPFIQRLEYKLTGKSVPFLAK
jgi:hypothetical protein